MTLPRFLRRRTPPAPDAAPLLLREFVYLDEVSVYSLLASWRGAIPAEHVDRDSHSRTDRSDAAIGASVGVLSSNVKSSQQAMVGRESQVLRKSNVQSTFKTLLEDLAASLFLRGPAADPPSVASAHAVAGNTDLLLAEGWLIDPEHLSRGSVVEVDVIVETEPIFRASTAMSALMEVLEKMPTSFPGVELHGLGEAAAMTRIIEALLARLVPIRGRARHYRYVEINEKAWLVHRHLIAQWPSAEQDATEPLFIVGVAEADYFWKDIRRVLFSDASYTMMCRVGRDGLQTNWTPVKLVEVLRKLAPDLAHSLDAFNETLGSGLDRAADGSGSHDASGRSEVLLAYSRAIVAQQDGVDFHPAEVVLGLDKAGLLTADDDTFQRVDVFRPRFHAIDEWLRTTYDLAIEPDALKRCREIAMLGTTSFYAEAVAPPGDAAGSGYAARSSADEHILDVEIVAMYW